MLCDHTEVYILCVAQIHFENELKWSLGCGACFCAALILRIACSRVGGFQKIVLTKSQPKNKMDGFTGGIGLPAHICCTLML